MEELLAKLTMLEFKQFGKADTDSICIYYKHKKSGTIIDIFGTDNVHIYYTGIGSEKYNIKYNSTNVLKKIAELL